MKSNPKTIIQIYLDSFWSNYILEVIKHMLHIEYCQISSLKIL
jgi:hypothetical protein